MTKKLKRQLLWASLVTLLPIPVSFFLNAPAGMGGHLPAFAWTSIAMVLGLWLCAFLTARDPGNRGRNEKPLALVFWVIPILSNLCCALTWALAMGYEFDPTALFMVPMGLLFAAIGNYLPKCRMNSTLGIKVAWAYTSEENWNATHRFGGKLWFVGGILIALAALLPVAIAVPAIIVIFVGMTVIPMVYSYRYYKMQKARGDELLPAALPIFSGKLGKYSWAAVIALLAFVGVLLYTGDIQYTLAEDCLEIQADFYSDDVLYYEDILSLEYRAENIPGHRVSGFGSFRLLMGFFRSEDLDTYVRYTYYNPEAAIVITTKNNTLVLSAETAAETRALYESLNERVPGQQAGDAFIRAGRCRSAEPGQWHCRPPGWKGSARSPEEP